jgi:hypothetical protein
MSKRDRLIGEQFGYLKVKSFYGYNERKLILWECECCCGNIIYVTSTDLTRGRKDNCGCKTKEKQRKAKLQKNKYDLTGEYGIGYCFNTGREFYFDMDDYDKIKDYCWYEYIDKRNQYSIPRANSIDEFGNRITIKMHHIITGKYYDHINRNTFNNRKYNLRKASFSENSRNKSIQKNNSSGFVGVSFDNKSNKWRAYIIIDDIRKHLGFYENKEDAIKIRLEAEEKYFGEFAPQKHLFEEYGIKV